MSANFLVNTFYVFLSIILIYGLYLTVQAVRGRPSWEQARVMGIPVFMFLWIEIVFYLALFESSFIIVSFFAELPFWMDLVFAIVIISLVAGIFFKLLKRVTFKPKLFIPLILTPLVFPGAGFVAKAAKVGTIEITEKYGLYFVKSTNSLTAFKPNFYKIIQNAPNEIGVYVVRKNDKVVYVGRAMEQRSGQSTSGLRKRLKEHYRGSSSGKKELSLYKDELHITTHPLNNVNEVKQLEAQLIRKYDTVNNGWNKRYED